MGRTKKVQSSEVELLEGESNGEVVVFTPDQQKEYDNAIIKFTPGEEKVKEVQKYRELKLDKEKWFQGEQDDEMYEKIHAAIADCRGYRQTIDPDVKLINAPFKKIIKDTKDKGEWIKDELLAVEEHLHAQKDPIDDEKKRISDENKAKKAARFIVRNQELTKLGASFVNGFFILNDVSYSVADIEGIDDDIYEKEILSQYKAEWQKAEDVRIAEQKKKDDEAGELKKQREELEEEKRLLREKENKITEENKRIEAEKEKRIADENRLKDEARKQKFKDRLGKLLDVFFDGVGITYKHDGKDIAKFGDIADMGDENFELFSTTHNKRAQDDRAEVERKRVVEADRKQNEAIQKAIEEEKERQVEVERKRVAALEEASDKDKFQEVINYLKKTPIFSLKTKKFQNKMNAVEVFLSDIEAL